MAPLIFTAKDPGSSWASAPMSVRGPPGCFFFLRLWLRRFSVNRASAMYWRSVSSSCDDPMLSKYLLTPRAGRLCNSLHLGRFIVEYLISGHSKRSLRDRVHSPPRACIHNCKSCPCVKPTFVVELMLHMGKIAPAPL